METGRLGAAERSRPRPRAAREHREPAGNHPTRQSQCPGLTEPGRNLPKAQAGAGPCSPGAPLPWHKRAGPFARQALRRQSTRRSDGASHLPERRPGRLGATWGRPAPRRCAAPCVAASQRARQAHGQANSAVRTPSPGSSPGLRAARSSRAGQQGGSCPVCPLLRLRDTQRDIDSGDLWTVSPHEQHRDGTKGASPSQRKSPASGWTKRNCPGRGRGKAPSPEQPGSCAHSSATGARQSIWRSTGPKLSWRTRCPGRERGDRAGRDALVRARASRTATGVRPTHTQGRGLGRGDGLKGKKPKRDKGRRDKTGAWQPPSPIEEGEKRTGGTSLGDWP